MKSLHDLYTEGIDLIKYIESGSVEDKEKQLHYVVKMALTEEEKQSVLDIKNSKNLLVFSDLFCPDCRVTLAVLENMRKINPIIEYRILSRNNHEETMEKLSGDTRIPLVINCLENKGIVIYNEYPEKIRKSIKEDDNVKLQYRKGFYKKNIIEQIYNEIS